MEKDLVFGGVNADGARGKWGTIKKAIRDTGASVWFMQETKCQVEGALKLDGFITYEHLRSKREGGGVALSARTELSPAFVKDGGDTVEALTVDINVNKMSISCTSAYGPQENASFDKKRDFWQYLGDEAVRADEKGKGFIVQGDPNGISCEIFRGSNIGKDLKDSLLSLCNKVKKIWTNSSFYAGCYNNNYSKIGAEIRIKK